MNKYESLKLENQLCFPLYACSKEIVRHYKPFLDELNLTYTQYIVMIILWEYGKMNVSVLGKKMFLDSGTLTPLLKKLEIKGYIKRTKLSTDERNLIIDLTNDGILLKEKAVSIPIKMGKCININVEEVQSLYKILYKILGNIEGE